MNLMDMIMNAQNGGVAKQLAQQFGVGEAKAREAVGQMLPSLSRGLRENAASPRGMDELLDALHKGGHERYLDDPGQLAETSTVDDGNAILGHVFGSKELSRDLASRAAAQTGLDTGLLKKMLPVVAAAAMGALSKQTAQAGPLAATSRGGAQLSSLISFLDADKDGSVMDDVVDLAKKLF